MEDRDAHTFAQFTFDIETFWRFDIFQIDPTKSRLQRSNDINQLIWIGFIDLDIEYIDTSKLLEQHALTFHHWLRSEWSNIAQTQYRRTVSDDAHQITARCVFKCSSWIGDDFFTR